MKYRTAFISDFDFFDYFGNILESDKLHLTDEFEEHLLSKVYTDGDNLFLVKTYSEFNSTLVPFTVYDRKSLESMIKFFTLKCTSPRRLTCDEANNRVRVNLGSTEELDNDRKYITHILKRTMDFGYDFDRYSKSMVVHHLNYIHHDNRSTNLVAISNSLHGQIHSGYLYEMFINENEQQDEFKEFILKHIA